MLRSALVIAALLWLAAAVMAADKHADPHYLASCTSAIARRSSFVHGYLHGYEEGFHLADLDLQMGRGTRDVRKSKEAREAAGYRREFGDKHFFQAGYLEGLRIGYADGAAGRSFRAVRELQAIGEVAREAISVGADPVFDQGFSQGYASGQHQGVQDGRSSAAASPPATCPAPSQAPHQPAFCAAYVLGYRVGYADGITNVARPVVTQAEVRGGAK